MTNWRVTVQTDSSQIKEVFVGNYIQPEDASRAALSQTGAARVLYVVPDYSNEPTYSSGTSDDYNSSSVGYNDDLTMLEGILLVLGGVSMFLGMFSSSLFQLSIFLFIICTIHIIIRKIKKELI